MIMAEWDRTPGREETAHGRMLRVAQAIAGVGIWEWNLLSNTTICSQVNRTLYGLEPGGEMPAGEDFLGLIHRDDRQRLKHTLELACLSRTYDAEFRVIWPDGSVHWLLGRGEVAADDSGRPLRMTGINMEITERKRAEESVRLSEANFRGIFAGAATGMAIVSPGGCFIDLNAAFCDIVGSTREQLLPESFWSLTYAEDRGREAKLYDLLLSLENPSVVLEKRYRRGNGSQIWVRESSSLARAPIDGSVQIIVLSEDISERKLAEEERKRHARELSEKNEQLSGALAIAEEATLMKSRFLANMSHEIRTPMNGVIGMANLALGTDLDEEQREYVQTIQSSGENLLHLINDILDISRIEAGKLQIASAPLDIRAVVDGVVKLAAIAAGAKGVLLTAQVDPSLPQWLAGDLMRVRQVLTNLVGNAVKFTSAGEVVVQAGVLWESETSLEVKLTVRDSGIGIDEKTIAHLFTPFRQADASVTRKYGGTGLGLAISRQLVKMMGGEIGVESAVGKGSTFWFTAVLEKTEALRREDPMFASRPRAVGFGKILVAEDNKINQRIAKQILEKAGHEVDVVENGLLAISKLMETSYDLVLMDVQMPEMDGLTATAHIRGLDGTIRTVPIIAMTAHAMTGDRDMCLQAGMDGYISKPFRPAEMLETVQHHLGASHHAELK